MLGVVGTSKVVCWLSAYAGVLVCLTNACSTSLMLCSEVASLFMGASASWQVLLIGNGQLNTFRIGYSLALPNTQHYHALAWLSCTLGHGAKGELYSSCWYNCLLISGLVQRLGFHAVGCFWSHALIGLPLGGSRNLGCVVVASAAQPPAHVQYILFSVIDQQLKKLK
ncbi:unnamed protein product [Rhizoctonia solani]|uniref:Uncharacterized protein n=1 Tax=Rhizoctonia solani TaxID=456999 RepID=A0A8H3AZG1_9AGAM|nr:unnamed protein product [Rhizoctonia solani]